MMIFESKLKAGMVLGDRYKVIAHIGSGGMSHVHLAEDLRLPGKRWAVKESISSEGAQGEIQAEAELLIALSHRMLPRVADFYGPDREGYCYLILDYIEGVTLGQYIMDNDGHLPAEIILGYAKQLLEVLKYLHGQHPPIIYRDLKPSNIMLAGRNELMLIDFGIARSFKSGAGEDTEKLGTVGFAAPEQYGGGQSQPVSDLYGLGALLLYMATGGKCSRWQPGMENQLHGRIPAPLIPVIRRLLRYHPEERYQSAEEVLLALEPIEVDTEAASRASGFRNQRRPAPQNRETTVVALLGVSPGLGTTHTSFAVSGCLSRIGATAWVDFSPGASVYGRIRGLLGATGENGVAGTGGIAGTAKAADSPLVWKGVHYRACPAGGDIAGLLDGKYRFVVLDLGTGGYEGAIEEFTGSDIPLLVASGADWRLEDTLHWLRRRGLTPQPNWRISLPLAGHSSAELLQSALGMERVYALPPQRDPFQDKGKLSEALEKLLPEFFKGRFSAKRAGIFQKKL